MKKNESLWRNSTFEKQVFDIQRQFYKQSRVKISKVWFNLIAQVRLSSIGFIYYAGFDTNRPVIVQVSQLVCQALEVVWCQSGAVLNYVVMGWRYCSLANWLADKKEVIPSKKKKQQLWADVFNQVGSEATRNKNSVKISVQAVLPCKKWHT